MSGIRAIIPAAGVGTRMRPLTHTKPKVLLPMAGRPMIGHLIEDLHSVGINEMTIVVGYFADKVESYCRKAFPDVNFRFVIQEDRLGLGHAIMTAIAPSDEKVFVVLGDTLFKGSLSAFAGDSAVLGLVKVVDPRRFGVAVIEDGRITDLEEKPEVPRSNYALAGLYYFPDAQLVSKSVQRLMDEDIKTRGEYQITDAMDLMLRDGHTFLPHILDGWFDCGVPETLVSTNDALFKIRTDANRVSADIAAANTIIEPVHIPEGVIVEDSTIGPNVHVGEGSVITGSTISQSIIDSKCQIENSNLSKSVLGESCKIAGFEGSIFVGDDASLITPED